MKTLQAQTLHRANFQQWTIHKKTEIQNKIGKDHDSSKFRATLMEIKFANMQNHNLNTEKPDFAKG